MEIQLKQFENGKPLILKQHQHLTEIIKALQQTRSFEEILQVTDKMGNSTEKYLIATNALLHLRSWKKLVQYCDQGLKCSPESEFQHLKGKALGKLGKNLQKIEFIQKAIKINPHVAAYHRNLGAAFYAEKQFEQAVGQHEITIKIEPSNSINHHNLGTTLYRLSRYERALEVFEKAIELNPKQALSYSWKGDCLNYLNRPQEALQCYSTAYELTSNPVYLRQKQKMQSLLLQQHPQHKI